MNLLKKEDIINSSIKLQDTEDFGAVYFLIKDNEIVYVGREMGGSIHLLLSYNCNKCGKPIPYQTTVCSDCKRQKKPKIKKERPHKYKTTMTEDSVGHLCKKCGIYKEWKFFPTSNGKHTPRCKECCKKDQLAYYHKNKIKINEKKKIKNQQSKIK